MLAMLMVVLLCSCGAERNKTSGVPSVPKATNETHNEISVQEEETETADSIETADTAEDIISDPNSFFERVEGIWFYADRGEIVSFQRGSSDSEAGPFGWTYAGAVYASDIFDTGYISECEIDTENEIARIVVFCPGIHDDFLDIDDCELVRIIDYSNLNSANELICTFEGVDLVWDLKYYGTDWDEAYDMMESNSIG